MLPSPSILYFFHNFLSHCPSLTIRLYILLPFLIIFPAATVAKVKLLLYSCCLLASVIEAEIERVPPIKLCNGLCHSIGGIEIIFQLPRLGCLGGMFFYWRVMQCIVFLPSSPPPSPPFMDYHY